jgi:hypothetical protein
MVSEEQISPTVPQVEPTHQVGSDAVGGRSQAFVFQSTFVAVLGRSTLARDLERVGDSTTIGDQSEAQLPRGIVSY